jgi:hypothetical protein
MAALARNKGSNNNQGRMTMMGMTEETTIPSATGTLDRKTSQASTNTCLFEQQQKTLLDD